MLWFNDFRRTERGQAVVEMAFVLPILLILIFGIVEFGRILNTYMIVTNLSREGARAGAIGSSDAGISSNVEANATGAGLNVGQVTVNINPSSSGSRARGSSVSVEVSYPVTLIDPIISAIAGNPYIVKAQTTMRVEG